MSQNESVFYVSVMLYCSESDWNDRIVLVCLYSLSPITMNINRFRCSLAHLNHFTEL